MQYNAGIGSKSFIGARRTLPALSQNKTYTLNARLLKTTCIVNNSIIVRVRSALNGTILGSTSYTIATNTAASVPIAMNFVAPSNLSTAIVEIERAASTNCANIQIDDVELIEQRMVWEDFATIGNASGYTANAGASVVVSNTNQTLQIAPTILATTNGVRKDIALDAGVAYTFTYDVAANATLSEKNYILCELLYGKDALYSYKIMSTQSANFVYTPTSSGTYTWRFRRVHSGANAPASSYTLDNLKVTYVIPYTRNECPETDLAYRFGFNTQEKDDEVYGAGNLNTAEFWEYDTRLGRRWNVDPVVKVWESPYLVNGGNPIQLSDPKGDDIKQRKKAISKAKEHSDANPTPNKKMYKMGAKNAKPGEPIDCSGLVSQCVVAGEEKNPNHGNQPSGVLNIENNTNPIALKNLEEGNLITFRAKKGYPYHVGIVTGIKRTEDGKTVIKVIHSSGSKGTHEDTWTVGDGSKYDKITYGFYKWDTKADTYRSNIQGVTISTERSTWQKIKKYFNDLID